LLLTILLLILEQIFIGPGFGKTEVNFSGLRKREGVGASSFFLNLVVKEHFMNVLLIIHVHLFEFIKINTQLG